MSALLPSAAGVVLYSLSPSTGAPAFLLLTSSRPSRNVTPPKGHLDPGEGAVDAALRETREECGVALTRGDLSPGQGEGGLWCHTVAYTLPAPTQRVPSGRKTVAYYLARVPPGTPVVLSDEHTAYTWAELEAGVSLVVQQELVELLRLAAEEVANKPRE